MGLRLILIITAFVVITVFVVGVFVVAQPAFAAVSRSADSHCGVPEIDPGSIRGALALLSCGVLLLTDRIRRK
jgi:hypothetical protein